ncbi:MAG: glycosyltransferase 2 family protein [Kosmotogales bacterium]|nr:glycosyltransferase 2 family protein [Kosmotogales bacterium]
MNKTIRNVFIAVLISVVFLLIFLSLTDIDQAIKSLENAKVKYLLLCLLISISIWFFEALTLKIISNMQKEKLSLFYLFRITVLGTFFSAITPFAAGGQPVQIIYMQKKGIKTSKATAIIISRFITYQIVITIIGIVAIIFAYPLMKNKVSNLAILAVFGFLINSAVLFFLFLFSLNKTVTSKLILFFIKILHKIKIVKNIEKVETKTISELEKFHSILKEAVKNPFKYSLAFISTFIQMFLVMTLPFFVALSLGLKNNFFEMIAAQSILYLIVAMIPTPGASGASEGGYALFFSPFFGSDVGAGLLLWRLFSYYLNIIVGGIVSFFESKNLAKSHSSKPSHKDQ